MEPYGEREGDGDVRSMIRCCWVPVYLTAEAEVHGNVVRGGLLVVTTPEAVLAGGGSIQCVCSVLSPDRTLGSHSV